MVGPSQTSKEGRAGNKPLAEVTLATKHPQKGRHSKGGQRVPHWKQAQVIIDDPVDPGIQTEPQSGDTSIPQTSSPAPINHSDPATALEILKRDFHAFREQTAKERAETEAYRVRIAELEKEQFLLRATLEHCTVCNDSLDRVA
ncbi:hypothetical protein ACLB2K_063073 [Fragaria x ananassa]